MTPDETQIQILANWPMSHAKRVTRDNWKNPEYRVILIEEVPVQTMLRDGASLRRLKTLI